MLPDGASLIYTSQNTPSQLPTLIHSTLGITSLLKRNPLKINVIDRDKIVVPTNWDSWGKIRVLANNFDAEVVSNSWSEDISSSPADIEAAKKAAEEDDEQPGQQRPPSNSAIARYEEWCRDPNSGGLAVVESAMHGDHWINVDSDDTQVFLERQLKILEAFKAKVPEKAPENAISLTSKRMEFSDEKSVSEHIGPVQFNMGGIQVDADDMLQRLKVKLSPLLLTQPLTKIPVQDRNAHTASPEGEREEGESPADNMVKEFDNDQLQSFFTGLMNRKGSTSDAPRS